MAAKQKATADYRALKKVLNQFFTFSFPMPKKGKDFTAQQKSAITRKWEKVAPYLNDKNKIDLTQYSFLKYPEIREGVFSRLSNVDGIRTDAGLIYKWPKTTVKESSREKGKFLVVIDPTVKDKYGREQQKRRDVFFPFPEKIKRNINLIQQYVDKLREKYRPQFIQWSYENTRSRIIFDIEKLNLYMPSDTENDLDDLREIAEQAIKQFKNLISPDSKKRERALEKFKKSELYGLLDREELPDIFAHFNYIRAAKNSQQTYNGVFFIYYL